MAAWFLNPWTMLIGALLIAAPILIHLINRLRVKRVRWAAMEFVLKAQKKLKRKMILQQILLLASRCLIVGLLGLLFGRFAGCGSMSGKDSRPTSHLIVLDDSPSMADGFRGENGKATDAFEEAKRVIVEQIVPSSSQATSPQYFEIVRTSDLANPRNFGQANAQVVEEIRTFLNSLKPATTRTEISSTFKSIEAWLKTKNPDYAKVVHYASDFRLSEWSVEGPGGTEAARNLKDAKVDLHLIDVVHPYRKPELKSLPYHDNIAIVEFRPTRPVVAKGEMIEMVLRVQNFGNSELKDVQISIRVNGDENRGGRRVAIPNLPANQERTIKVEIMNDRIGSAEKPLERFSLISAVLETAEPGGIAIDNARHAVVEVREKVQFLVVEGRPTQKDKRDGDGFFLRILFGNVLGGYAWDYKTPKDLETIDLKKYSVVYLLNVPTISENASKAIDTYIREGGGVGVFLGPDIKPQDYKALYADGNGWFPVPLPDKPTEPLKEEEQLLRRFNMQKKLMLRDRSYKLHPALNGLYTDERGLISRDEEELEKYFRFISINQYWKIARIGNWRSDKNIAELFCLPNDQPISNYEGAVQAIENKIPVEEIKFEKSKAVLAKYKDLLRKTRSGSEQLYKLAELLDQFLADKRSEGDPDEPILREFWTATEVADLKNEVTRLRDITKFGDPLYIARSLGKGRVTLITTTAGDQWNDWASAPPGNVTFGPMMKEMAIYLAGGMAEENRSVGNPFIINLDSTKYRQIVTRTSLSHDPSKDAKTNPELAPFVDLGTQTMETAEQNSFRLNFGQTIKPGAYIMTLSQIRPAGSVEGVEAPEYRASAFNIDTTNESDLKRTSSDDLQQYLPGALVHSPSETGWLDQLKNKSKDLSEFGSLFLLLLMLLIFEQALAVKMSYHTTNSDVSSLAPSAAAAMQTRSTKPKDA